MPTFEFRCGVTVTLKRAENRFALKHLQAEGDRIRVLALSGKPVPRDLADISERAFSYFAGWCVEDDPPPAALEELAVLGLAETESARILRARWLRYVLLSNEDEASRFMSACMAANYG
jgi:hypothetical protein